jgi:hypothetical protein
VTAPLTPEEREAVAALRALAKKWPDDLMLFADAGAPRGALRVVRRSELDLGSRATFERCVLASISIDCDGGDP